MQDTLPVSTRIIRLISKMISFGILYFFGLDFLSVKGKAILALPMEHTKNE